MIHAEHARRQPARHRSPQLALKRTANLRDVAVAGQLPTYATQPKDVLDQILPAIHYAHVRMVAPGVPKLVDFWGLNSWEVPRLS